MKAVVLKHNYPAGWLGEMVDFLPHCTGFDLYDEDQIKVLGERTKVENLYIPWLVLPESKEKLVEYFNLDNVSAVIIYSPRTMFPVNSGKIWKVRKWR